MSGPTSSAPIPKRDPLRFWVTRVCVFSLAVIAIGFLIPLTTVSHIDHTHPNYRAAKTASDLRSAIMMYQWEHKRFPALPGLPAGRDAIIDTSETAGLMSILTSAPGNALAAELNPRAIAYFTDRSAKSATSPGLWNTGTGAHLKDPWGNDYRVLMDTDYNNQVDIQYPDGTVEKVYNIVVIHSLGRNGVMDRTRGFKDDDIFAQ